MACRAAVAQEGYSGLWGWGGSIGLQWPVGLVWLKNLKVACRLRYCKIIYKFRVLIKLAKIKCFIILNVNIYFDN